MRLVVDVCMPPELAEQLKASGFDAIYWPEIGDPRAMDDQIVQWCAEQEAVIITHDLDFGDLLAASGASGPSVIIVREQSTDPSDILVLLRNALEQFADELSHGCLISLNATSARTRSLPIR